MVKDGGEGKQIFVAFKPRTCGRGHVIHGVARGAKKVSHMALKTAALCPGNDGCAVKLMSVKLMPVINPRS